MNQTFYTCRHCGNIIAMIRDNGVPVYCCGEKMPRLIPGATEGAREKHAPVFHVDGNTVHVTVGFLEHPMTPEHHIQWICLETARGIQYVHLNPGDPPKASFPLSQGDRVENVYAFCNQHDLWAEQ